MPLVTLNEVEAAEQISLMDPDLVLQLRRADVAEDTIAAMGHAKFRTVKKFALFGKDEEAVEAGLKILGLKREDGIAAFSEIAAVQVAWLAVRTYHQQDEVKRAETKLQGLVSPYEVERVHVRTDVVRTSTRGDGRSTIAGAVNN